MSTLNDLDYDDLLLLRDGFDELDDAAKERARDWYRECIDEDDFSCEIDEFASICDILGIDLKTHEVALMSGKTRSDPNIYWSVGYCQSDYACSRAPTITRRRRAPSCARSTTTTRGSRSRSRWH
jgi:hypothetical protein